MALKGKGKDVRYLKTFRKVNVYLKHILIPCIKADVCPALNTHIYSCKFTNVYILFY